MKELSSQSLHKIRDIIPGENYANLRARLDQYLPKELAEMFARVSLSSASAAWFGDDNVDYKTYAQASAAEKEEIAAELENAKTQVSATLAGMMPFVDKMFVVPSADEIFWHRTPGGDMRVTLTQWGFRRKDLGQNVDIIDILINAPRTIKQVDVVIHCLYSDGGPAPEQPFDLLIFNNRKECTANEQGDYHLGLIYAGKTFAVESRDGAKHVDFTVAPDAEYNVTFDLYTDYTVEVRNQHGDAMPGFEIRVDGAPAVTGDDGVYRPGQVLLTPAKKVTVSLPDGSAPAGYELKRDAAENAFVYEIQEKQVLPPPPPPPPEPEKWITVRLLDIDGKPLGGLPFTIRPKKGADINAVTDADGRARINAKELPAGMKYRVMFKVTPEYRQQQSQNNNNNNAAQ